MRAIITVIGKDTVGILAWVSSKCAEYNVNVMDVTQSVLQDMFAMIMMVDTSRISVEFTQFAELLENEGSKKNLTVKVMHEDIFNAMHTV